MCDFHSVIISTDGRVFHWPSNSHTEIAERYGLHNGPDKREFYECEWDGVGEMPLNLVRARAYGIEHDIPSIVYRTAERHYSKLAAILAGELAAEDTPPFDRPEYVDVRERPAALAREAAEKAAREERERIAREEREQRAAELAKACADAESLAAAVQAMAAPQLGDMPLAARAHFVRLLADSVSAKLGDVFEDELDEACEQAREQGFEEGERAGWDSASDELYSYECVAENWRNFVPDDELEELRAEGYSAGEADGYAKGVAAALAGLHTQAPSPDGFTASGLPRFLLQPRD